MTNVLVGSGPLALRPAANLPNIEYHDTDHNIIWRCDGVNWSVVAGSSLNANPMQGPGDLAAGGQQGVPVRIPAATADDLVLTSNASAAGGMDWEAGGGGASTLAALTDVTLTSPQEGDLLRYTNGKWENSMDVSPKVLPVTWSPTDRTQDQTAVVLTIPADCLVLGLYWRRDIPASAGATPTLNITDAAGLISASPFNLASDDTSLFATTNASSSALSDLAATSGIWPGGISLYVPDPITFAYVAGITPGTTTPEFTLAVVYVPIA